MLADAAVWSSPNPKIVLCVRSERWVAQDRPVQMYGLTGTCGRSCH